MKVDKRHFLTYMNFIIMVVCAAFILSLGLENLMMVELYPIYIVFELMGCPYEIPFAWIQTIITIIVAMYVIYLAGVFMLSSNDNSHTYDDLYNRLKDNPGHTKKKGNPHPVDDNELVYENLCDARRETIMAEIKSVRNQILTGIGISSTVIGLVVIFVKGQ